MQRATKPDRAALIAEKAQGLYYRWGTHWNTGAGLVVWQAIKMSLVRAGVALRWPVVRPTISLRQVAPEEDTMYLWFGLSDPKQVTVSAVDRENDGGRIEEDRSNGDSVKILGIGDSFLEFLQESSLSVIHKLAMNNEGTAHLTTNELINVDLISACCYGRVQIQSLIPEFIELYHPNILLFVVVERNLYSWVDMPMPPGEAD